VTEAKTAPYAYEFKGFMDELAKSEPWCSAGDDEVGRWLTGGFDVLERTLKNIAQNYRDDRAYVARERIREIIFGPGTARERHAELDKFLMTL
jgi:hypothetical protein